VTARYLGPGASASDIAEAWPDWFEANRSVIGDNPDVIRPGQLLVAPHR
jgi:nucleoid-associated protein YgaU